MCIILSDSTPSATTLLLTPLRQKNTYQLLYINSIESKRSEALMIVPIPNTIQTNRFELFELTDEQTKGMCDTIGSVVRQRYTELASLRAGRRMKLQVHTVGKYDISIAPNWKDLESKSPWDHFKVDKNRCKQILKGLQQQYGSNGFAFVIAQYREKLLTNSGFGVSFQHSTGFLPTAHEIPENGENMVDMDVTCVALQQMIEPISTASLHFIRSEQLQKLISYIPLVTIQGKKITLAKNINFGIVQNWQATGVKNINLLTRSYNPDIEDYAHSEKYYGWEHKFLHNIQSRYRSKVLNPISGRYVNKNGRIGVKLQRGDSLLY